MSKTAEYPPRIPGETARYEDDPFELGEIDDRELEVVENNFLPQPEDLIFRPRLKKVTLTLDEKSIAFFKTQAARRNTSYQRIIRTLLAEYVDRQEQHNQKTNL